MVLAVTTGSGPFDLSPEDAAKIVGVHADTIKRWAIRGKIPAFRTPGGWWRFRLSDLESWKTAGLEREVEPEATSA